MLLLALEKRYNFELASLSVQAHGYSVFLSEVRGRLVHPFVLLCLVGLETCGLTSPFDLDTQFCQDDAHFDASMRACPACEDTPARLRGRRIAFTGVPMALEYERTRDLELWEITPI